MVFDTDSSERRIISGIARYLPIVSSVIYRSWDRYMREDANRIPGAIIRSIANYMWEYNRIGLRDAFSEFPSNQVRIVTENNCIDCVFDERFCGRIKKSSPVRPSGIRTERALAFDRQEYIEGLPPELEHFYISWRLNDIGNAITVYVCYPRPSGSGFEWSKFVDKHANIVTLDTSELPFAPQRKLPITPKKINRKKTDRNNDN